MADDYRPIVRESAPRKSAKKATRKRAAKKTAPPPVETAPSDAPAENEESA